MMQRTEISRLRKSGRRLRPFLLFAVVIWLVVGLYRLCDVPPRVVVLKGTNVNYFVTPRNTSFNGQECYRCISDSFEVTDNGIILGIHHSLVELQRRKGMPWGSGLSSYSLYDDMKEGDRFTVDAGGVILVVREHRILQLTAEGILQDLGPLPEGVIQVARSREAGYAYLFNTGGYLEPANLYTLSDVNGSASLLASLSCMPAALVEAPDGIYVLTQCKEVFQLLGPNKRRVITLPDINRGLFDESKHDSPKSIACTDDGRIVFVSTQNTVYAILASVGVPVTRELGGTIRWRDGVLFVLDNDRHFLVGIEGIPDSLNLTEDSN